jgi:hypothetical protein
MNFALHILPYICILYNVISTFYDVLEDLINNPLSSGSNFVWQKMHLFSIFDFTGATRLKNWQDQGPGFGIFGTDKMG